MTSDSEIAPTPEWMTFTRTSLVRELFQRGLDGLGAAPDVRLHDDVEVLYLALLDTREQVVERDLLGDAEGLILLLLLALLTSSLAMRSSATALKVSPAPGTSLIPAISTGRTAWLRLPAGPLSFIIVLTRPTAVPAMMMSPWCRVPFWTRTVIMGPRPLVQPRLDDGALGRAVRVGLELLDLGQDDKVFKGDCLCPRRSWRRSGRLWCRRPTPR